jgi:hypothetical protein
MDRLRLFKHYKRGGWRVSYINNAAVVYGNKKLLVVYAEVRSNRSSIMSGLFEDGTVWFWQTHTEEAFDKRFGTKKITYKSALGFLKRFIRTKRAHNTKYLKLLHSKLQREAADVVSQ